MKKLLIWQIILRRTYYYRLRVHFPLPYQRVQRHDRGQRCEAAIQTSNTFRISVSGFYWHTIPDMPFPVV